MKHLFVSLLILLACAYLCGFADVQERSHIVGGLTGTPLTASVGDTVLRVAREKNLPNIAGKADIFGRTTPTGVETVQYLGTKDGKAFFKRRTVNVETGATTMNSTSLIIPNTATTTHSGSVNVYGPSGHGSGSYSGTSTTVGPPTVIPAHPPAPMVMDEGSLLLSVHLAKKPAQLSVAGKTLTILQADNPKLPLRAVGVRTRKDADVERFGAARVAALGAWRANLIDRIARGVCYPDARPVKADTCRLSFDRDRT